MATDPPLKKTIVIHEQTVELFSLDGRTWVMNPAEIRELEKRREEKLREVVGLVRRQFQRVGGDARRFVMGRRR